MPPRNLKKALIFRLPSSVYMFRKNQSMNHHVVYVLPVVKGDELKGGEHGPEQVVEAGEPVVGVTPNVTQAGVAVRTGPK